MLNNVDPNLCDKSPLEESDPVKRMAKVIDNAKKLGVDTAATPEQLAAGNPDLNGLFLGEIYNAFANPFNENENYYQLIQIAKINYQLTLIQMKSSKN